MRLVQGASLSEAQNLLSLQATLKRTILIALNSSFTRLQVSSSASFLHKILQDKRSQATILYPSISDTSISKWLPSGGCMYPSPCHIERKSDRRSSFFQSFHPLAFHPLAEKHTICNAGPVPGISV